MISRTAVLALVVVFAGLRPVALAQQSPFRVLQPQSFAHYTALFVQQEKAATGQQATDPWPWIAANAPLFESSDKSFEEMYYFRWYAWQKHLVRGNSGYLVTEWLPRPALPDYGVLPDAAPFHLNEARWLRDAGIAQDYARYWTLPGSDPRKYSFPLADSVRNVALAQGSWQFARQLLPGLEANYRAWQVSNQDANGLYWQIDTRDAMEKSIGGDGYRTPLNTYQYADARAIADLATDAATKQEYTAKAEALLPRIERLWNPDAQFYEVVSPSADSGIRKQKKFIDPGTQLQFTGTRELIGYLPWLYLSPASSHAVAWQQLFDPKGFAGTYGPTTAERRSPRFRFASNDQCTWNGPSWPYATTQTLLALANLLNGPPQHSIDDARYYQLFAAYVRSQHLTLSSGAVVDWIDEDLDADTDEWIAKDMLLAKHSQVGRGNYYNHSGFTDPLLTGLIGLRPQADNTVVLHPLLPPRRWSYFAIDGVPYHGHLLTIFYDATGAQYHRGKGLTLLIDGRRAAHRPGLMPLTATLPEDGSLQR
ncbi:MAG: hypothetical protein KGK08_09835 [Acidobacteriota bacterium]|nr:hypothetical protein [Acidobacteriota bacterium]